MSPYILYLLTYLFRAFIVYQLLSSLGWLAATPSISWTGFRDIVNSGAVDKCTVYENVGKANCIISGNATEVSFSRHMSFAEQIAHESFNQTAIKDIDVLYKTYRSMYSQLYDIFFMMLMIYGVYVLIKVLMANRGDVMDHPLLTQNSNEFTLIKNVKTRFDDVIGLEPVKKQLKEYVKYITARSSYISAGAKLPKGLLFVGPPGTGKTLLAKALAGESGVSFISITGSDFIEVFVGVGSQRMRKLFKSARSNSPCIIFIDEIDAIGQKRSSVSTGHNEHGSTLNKLLVEMDGFTDDDQIMVIGATNRADSLDPALTRSGRFDQKIVFDSPNIDERSKMFELYLNKIRLTHKIKENFEDTCKRLAAITAGLSGADIANICNQAVLTYMQRSGEAKAKLLSLLTPTLRAEDPKDVLTIAKRQVEEVTDKEDVEEDTKDQAEESKTEDQTEENSSTDKKSQLKKFLASQEDTPLDGTSFQDIQKSIDDIVVGMEKRERMMTETEKNTVAHHEAGHALMAYLIKETEPPVKVSIVPRGEAALGFSQQEPVDKKLHTKEELAGRISVLLGGRVAEQVMFDKITTGASDDIDKLTKIAYGMIGRYGMTSELGLLNYISEYDDTASQDTKREIDRHAKQLVDNIYEQTKQILEANKKHIVAIADYLKEKEVLLNTDLAEILPEDIKDSVELEI